MTEQPPTEQPIADLTDEALVGLVLIDQEQYLHLMRRYEARLLRYLKGLTGLDQDDVEDMLQEAFINAYRNLRGFDRSRKFSPWIYRIARNAAISDLRKRQARQRHLVPNLGDEALERIASDEDISQEHDRRLEVGEVRTVLQRLPDKHREILVLFYLEQLDYEEIAAVLRLPVGTVSSRLNRAKAFFRRQYPATGDTKSETS
jgi:RNA polymerase sigma-70 factor (ECF subfamily)